MGIARRIKRQLAFARAIPPRQMARRLWLMLRRKFEAHLRPKLPALGLARGAVPPAPLFPARAASAVVENAGWTFRFLHRDVAMGPVVDWAAPSDSPADQLWRMNLHYMEYLEGAEDKQLQDLILQWIAANPAYAPGSTSDGWNAYALSLRTVVWMQQLALRRDRLSSAAVERIERSLEQQVAYLDRHLETDVGGNHLIKNVKALLWASAFFDGGPARDWRRRGLRLLGRELRRQILSDGMHYELSPSYHCQVFADLLEIRHALGDPLSGQLDAVLEIMAQATADLAHPDGLSAQFGDAGLHMAYSPTHCMSAYAALFGSAPEPRTAFCLTQAGYCGARHGGSYVVADGGAIAPPSLPAHGQGDIGSFEWSVHGQRVIVDQGVFEYIAGDRRMASRTAASHNTLHVEGADQAEFYGAFRIGRRARVTVHERVPAGGNVLLDFSHDGYASLPGRPIHRRRMHLAPHRIRIEDSIEGQLSRSARITMLLHPFAAVQQVNTGKLRLICGSAAARITSALPIAVEPAVWWPDMGQEVETLRLVVALPPEIDNCWIELEAEPAAKGC